VGLRGSFSPQEISKIKKLKESMNFKRLIISDKEKISLKNKLSISKN
jgi:hypothetical protein